MALLRTLEHQSKDAQALVNQPQVGCGWRARPPSTGQERAALSQDTGARPAPCRLWSSVSWGMEGHGSPS